MNALKAVKKTDDQLVVENYIVLFGGRDLEGTVNDNVNADGSRGEFFTKATDLRSAFTNTNVLYVDWEHGYMGGQGEPGADEPSGFVDWTTAKADDRGVRVQRILDRRLEYVRMLEPLIDEGLIGTSSEAVPGRVQKADTGEILRWPLRRDSLTVTPMEPRMLTENAMQAVKALADKMPSLKSILPEDTLPATAQKSPASTGDPYLATATIQIDPSDLADQIVQRLRQPVEAPADSVDIDAVDVDVEDQHEDGDAATSAPAVEPEEAPEPDEARLAEVLGEFVETISGQLQEVIS